MGERGLHVKRRRHTPEQVIRKLREADRMLGEGKTILEGASRSTSSSSPRLAEASVLIADWREDRTLAGYTPR
jgi:hypothetical protein